MGGLVERFDSRMRFLSFEKGRDWILSSLALGFGDVLFLWRETLILKLLIGIGLMLAKALAHNKAKRVYIIGRRKEKLDEAVEQIGREGVVIPLVGDITDQESLKKMADAVREREGYIDLLIPNAGESRINPLLSLLRLWAIVRFGYLMGFD